MASDDILQLKESANISASRLLNLQEVPCFFLRFAFSLIEQLVSLFTNGNVSLSHTHADFYTEHTPQFQKHIITFFLFP